MSIYTISDLHLSFGTDKPMDVFGGKWENYTDKLKENWESCVGEDDLVILPGDISWATYIEEADADFSYVHSLPGKKLILKGNHDYWWTTINKLNTYLVQKEFSSISFLHNTAMVYENIAICGTRGWTLPSANATGKDVKIFEREKQRLLLSLEDAARHKCEKIIVMMHYPPVDVNGTNHDFLEIMKLYGVKECYFGHLHAEAQKYAVQGEVDGIRLKLVSCDYLNFMPLKIEL